MASSNPWAIGGNLIFPANWAKEQVLIGLEPESKQEEHGSICPAQLSKRIKYCVEIAIGMHD